MKKKEKLINENPMLKEETLQCHDQALAHQELMSISSTHKKSLYAFLVMVVSVAYIWYNFDSIVAFNCRYGGEINVYICMLLFGFTWLVWSKPLWAKYAIFPCAIAQGYLIGYLAKKFDTCYPGVFFLALLVFFMVVFMDANNITKVDAKMRKRIIVGLFGLFFLFVLELFFGMLGFHNRLGCNRPIYRTSWIGVVFSVCVMVLAYFSLSSNMDIVKQCAKNKYSKSIEWYCALALLTTLQWMIYMGMIHLWDQYMRNRYRAGWV